MPVLTHHALCATINPFRKLIDFTLGEDGTDDDAILALVEKAMKYGIHTGVCVCLSVCLLCTSTTDVVPLFMVMCTSINTCLPGRSPKGW